MKKLFPLLFLLVFSVAKAEVTAEKNFNLCMSQMQQQGALQCATVPNGRPKTGPLVQRTESEQLISYNFYCLWTDSNFKEGLGSCYIQKFSAKGPAPIFVSIANPGQDSQKDPLCPKSGSVLNLNTKSAGEVISLSGLPFQLIYDSAMDSSRPANRSVDLKMAYPSTAKFEDIPNKSLNISVNGQFYQSRNLGQTYNIHANEPLDLSLFSQSPFVISSSMHFQVVATFTTPLETEPTTGFEIAAFDKKIAVYKPEVWGLGSWTLANHHYYDAESKVIHWGYSGTTSADLPIKNFSGLGDVYMGTDEIGSEIYLFDSLGRHLETRTSLMGVPIYKFKYLDDHKLDQIIDRDNLITQILRDGSGNPVGIRAPFGQTTTFMVNSHGKLSKITDAVGSVHEFTYQDVGSGLLSEITYPSGLRTAFEYDTVGLFTKEVKSNGAIQELFTSLLENIQQVQFFKNNGAQETSQTLTDTLGTLQTTTKDSNGDTVLISKFTDSHQIKDLGIMSIETTTSNDIRFGSLVKAPTRVTMTARGLPYSFAYRDSKYTYSVSYLDGQGPFEIAELKTIENQTLVNSGLTRFTTTIFNGPAKTLETSSSGVNRQKIYFDDKERITKIENTGVLTTNLSFNAYGQLVNINQGNAQQSFAYNPQGFLAQSRDPKGNVTNYERNANGQVTKKTLPNGDLISFSYTPSGQLKEIHAPNGQVHRFAQSVLDQVVSYLTPASSETTYDYDQFGRILRMTKPSGAQAKYTYKNGTDFIEKIETPNGNYLFNKIDPQGRPLEIISPDGIKTSMVWVGNELSTLNQYDGSFPIGSIVTSISGDFKLTSVTTSGTGPVSYEYDVDGRMTRAGEEFYIYQFNNTPRSESGPETASVTISLHPVFNYGYRRTIQNYQTEGEVIDGINYNFKNSQTVTSQNRSVSIETLADKNHSIVRSRSQKNNTAVDDFYQYDANNRLVNVSGRLSANYEFPPGSNNNIKKYTHGNKVTTGSYDNQDRLLSLKGSIERNFTYSADGDLTEISNCLGQKKFEYDFFGNLKKVILPNGTIIEYKIDAFNRRVAKLINGQVQNYYVWQGANRLSAVLNRFGQTEMNFIYGIHPIAPVYMMDYRSANGLRDAAHGTRFPILANERGDIRAIINTNDGSIVQEIEYDEYGAILNDSSVTPSRPEGFQPLGFVAGLTDRQTGLVRFGARDYDPVVGRWTSKDPIGFGGGDTNLMGYVANDPINKIDPSGLYEVCTTPLSGFSSEFGPVYHQYLCANGVCGGQTRSGGPMSSPGMNSNDPAPGSTGSTCKEGPKDNQKCMDDCIAGAIGGSRPNYSVINVGGSNCQKWANDTVNQCAARCGGK